MVAAAEFEEFPGDGVGEMDGPGAITLVSTELAEHHHHHYKSDENGGGNYQLLPELLVHLKSIGLIQYNRDTANRNTQSMPRFKRRPYRPDSPLPVASTAGAIRSAANAT